MSELKDFGLQYVNPDLVDVSPPVNEGWKTTKDGGGGTNRSDIDSGLDHTRDVKAGLDKGFEQEDFDRLRRSSDPQGKAVGDAHSMFWGDDPITVTKEGDQFSTDDGRHRLAAAQDRGERSLPMRVYAPEDDPEFSRREYDYARSHGAPEQKDTSMNHESGRGRMEHNSVETPEASKSPEISHVEGKTPEEHQQYHDATSGGGTDSGADPMNGDNQKSATDLSDNMDGGEQSSRPREQGHEDLDQLDSRSNAG
jgi:hypothetical protein